MPQSSAYYPASTTASSIYTIQNCQLLQSDSDYQRHRAKDNHRQARDQDRFYQMHGNDKRACRDAVSSVGR
ncbi:hypothetical protein MMC30_008166 [Trapelia coarctata]|nr:hypothetical protein [Trapelia coarctata]